MQLLVQLVADVLADGQRVEQRPFLEDHAEVGADRHQLVFRHAIDLLAVDEDMSEAGRSSPSARRRMVDLPAPLAPRKIFVWPVCSVKLTSRRITFSSNARLTMSKTTIGPPKARASSSSAERVACGLATSVDQHDQDFRHHEVHGDDRHRARHDRQLRRVADALRAAGRPQPDVAADRHDGEPEEHRLDQPHPDVLDVEPLDHAAPVDGAGDVELQHGDNPAADHADAGREDAEQRHHQQAGEHARHDQLADRIGAERAQRRNLIGDLHRPELGRDAGADASRHHQAGQHRTQLLDHRRADQAADHRPRAELVERDARIERQHHPGEQPGEQHDRQRADADRVELLDDVAVVDRRRHHRPADLAEQPDVLLDLEDRVLRPGLDPRGQASGGSRPAPARGSSAAGCDRAASPPSRTPGWRPRLSSGPAAPRRARPARPAS